MNDIDMIIQLAKLKETDYKNTLAITILIELLIEKGIIDKNEISKKANQLDDMLTNTVDRSTASK
ncbi:MAG: hypothetical protein PHP06_09575 [Clostridia bacterium]|nr:hypothetical protein [Clostridia bacterium]